MSDQETLAHRAWLGYVQPVGLVVSVPALLAADAHVDKRRVASIHEEFLEYLEATAECSVTQRWERLVADILHWQSDDLFPLKNDQSKRESLEVWLDEYRETLVPTHIVVDPDSRKNPALPPIALVQCLEHATDFDRVSKEDTRRWQASAQLKFERLLREKHVTLGILFNGTAIRLVYAPRGESSGYITFRFDEMQTVAGRPILAALHMLLHTERMFDLGEKQRLPHILAESRKYQNDVSTLLADQVMLALFELLRGFQNADATRPIEPLHKALADDPNSVYGGLLTVLLRLVFILYAEDRDLMSSDAVYAQHYSVTGLFDKLRIDEGRHPDRAMDLRYGAWSRLLSLFRLVHRGGRNGAFELPERKGRLFDPDRFPFLEGGHIDELDSRTVFESIPLVSDGTVYRVLRNLLILDGERLSYRTLDVEQIGSVYEAMMGFNLEVADGPSIAIKPVKPGGAPTTINLEKLLAEKNADRGKKFKELTDQTLTGNAAETLKTANDISDLLVALDRKIDDRITPEPVPKGSMILQPSDERRRSGSHYTPRLLTEPIVRQTLTPVLAAFGDNIRPENILNLKICDPAMGSGAFLVEACRQLGDLLVESWHRNDCLPWDIPDDEDEVLYARRTIARRCLYGVDINPMAADLAKLSLWLVTLAKKHPFTFLDHSLRYGDSLVGLRPMQISGFHWNPGLQQDMFRRKIQGQINPAIRTRMEILNAPESVTYSVQEAKLKSADKTLDLVRFVGDTVVAVMQRNLKERQRLAILADWQMKMAEYLDGKVDTESKELRPRELVEAVNNLRSGGRPIRPFHWEIEFPEVFYETKERKAVGFDVVVGNPPYVQLQKNGGELAKIYEPFGYKTFCGTGDIYCLFYELCHRLLRPNGVAGFITSNKWMRAGYGENTRSFLAKNTNPRLLVDFAGVKVFESATVDPNVLIFAKEKNEDHTVAISLQGNSLKEWSDFSCQVGAPATARSTAPSSALMTQAFTAEPWVILSPIERSIKQKIEAVGTPLKDWDINIYRGILTGFNDAFIITGAKKDELIAADPKSAEIIRPILRGRNIKRYGYDFADEWLINTHNGVKEKGIKPINIDDFPAVKKHLDSYYPQLEKRADKGDSPYNLRNCAYMDVFSKPKIFYREIGFVLDAIYMEQEFIINNKLYCLTGEKLKYLLGIFNSKMFDYILGTTANVTGNKGWDFMQHIHIPVPATEQELRLITLTERRLAGEVIDSEIDDLVYKLYGLTAEEIAVIEIQ